MKHILKNTWIVLTDKERKRFLRFVISDILISLMDIFSLFLLLWIVQFYIQPEVSTGPAFLSSWFNKSSLLFITVFFICFSVKNILAFLLVKAQFAFCSDVAVRISENNLEKFQQGSYDEFISNDSSRFVRKIAFQPFEFSQHVLSGIQQIIIQASLITITVLAIVIIQPVLFFLLMALLLPPVIVVFYWIKKQQAAARTHIQSTNEISYRFLSDALKGFVEGNLFNRNAFFRRRFVQARRKFSDSLFRFQSLQSIPGRIMEIFAVLGLVILIAIAEWMGNNSQSTFMTIGAFMAGAYKIIPGLVKVINLTGQIKAFEFSLSDFEKGHFVADNNTDKREIQSLFLKDLSFQYNGHPVLQNFSLQVRKGDFVGIRGKSGCGKTTLFNLLLGFYEQRDGTIVINNNKADRAELKSYWPSIAYIRQQNFLIHDSILKNITLEEDGVDQARLKEALSIAGLEELIQQSPDGHEKMITENGKNISGGQQQRIALARAIYKDADLYLLDEPFSELDEASEASMLTYFREMAGRGKIILMITHHSNSLRFCNKTVELNEY